MIFNIQRYSTHDGSGIRTNIFFKGCPLRCKWCSNPESQLPEAEIFFDPKKCIGCLNCTKVDTSGAFAMEEGQIVFNKSKLSDATLYRDICPTKAIEVVGEIMTVDGIMAIVEKDIPFYNASDGGVTISGGEPFYDPDFLLDLVIALKKRNIHIAIETCLDVPFEDIEPIVPWIDVFLADLKTLNEEQMMTYTSGSVKRVTDNLKALDALQANVIVRVPVIPSFNAYEEALKDIIDFVSKLKNVSEIHLLPYHIYGANKYTLLGELYEGPKETVDISQLRIYIAYAKEKGLNAMIGG